MKVLGRTGKVVGRDVVVSDLLRIGAAPDNEFRVVVPGVSRHHARVVKDGDAFWLEDAGSTNGTFLNGQRVARERLRHLDVITLGRDVDLITVASQHGDTGAQPLPRAVEDAWLEAVDARDLGRVDIPLGEITLGRLAPSNVLLDSPVVSHLHARIRRTADHVIIQDLDSANGTFINGAAIKEAMPLADGDTLAIAGSRHFRVHIVGNARRAKSTEGTASQPVVFDPAWQTRLVWSADELGQLEAERRRILDSIKKEPALAAAVGTPVAAPAPPPAKAAPQPAKAAAAPAPAKPAAAPAAEQPKAVGLPAEKPAAVPPVVAKPTPPPAAVKPPAAPPATPPKPAVASPPAAAPVAPKPALAPPQSTPASPPVEKPVPAAPPVAAKLPVPPAAVKAPAAPAGVEPKPAAVLPPGAAPAPAAPKPAPPAAKPVASRPSDDALTVAASPFAAPTIVSTRGIRAVKLTGDKGTFTLEPGRHSVGRSDAAGVPIIDPQVSRAHAVISVAGLEARVEDTGSSNGTFVNSVRVPAGGAAIKTGDRLAFGSLEFTVELVS